MVAIGKKTTDSEVALVFSMLEISEASLKKLPINIPTQRIWFEAENRLQLEFEDEAALLDKPYHDADEKSWVLTEVVFWANQDKGLPYTGSMPFDIDFSMSRDQVRIIMTANNLGAPEMAGLSGEVDVWAVDAIEITVDFSGVGSSIRCVGITLISE